MASPSTSYFPYNDEVECVLDDEADHGVQVVGLGAEGVDEISEEAEEDGEEAAADEGGDEHEDAVKAVGEAEEAAQGGRRGGLLAVVVTAAGRPGSSIGRSSWSWSRGGLL